MQIVAAALALLALALDVQAAELRVCQHDAGRYAYRIELANLILARTAATHGELHIAPALVEDPPQERCLLQLRDGEVDLAYVPPNAERLQQFDMLPFDIHAGMLGYRLLLIRREDAPRFAQVRTLDDLRQLRGGFVSQWSDFSVFALNGLPVVGTPRPENLLAMLDGHRFDYYHRAPHEVWAEIDDVAAQYPQLMVEPSLALVYPLPVYFAFNRQNIELRERFEDGLRLIQLDGSFQQLLFRHFGKELERSRLHERRLLILGNDLPEGLPAPDSRFWLQR
ncbi:substrate-binding periplasmic protein [Pseudomonas sp. Gutcm_11s]|uniref:substrate-binding periplasmic protein n=1 Tax=Pseudomonas sp. Gutcm_11s TaxID=3026088 RepID=UPI00235EEE41|nr:hypothetical protein [Pseudomonas sp. Gutcm_11s]MDD0841523.1 hypothetical protein [Pseudomonas sp. Gutcm_11s]